MRPVRNLMPLAALAVLLWGHPAGASVELGLGADYWTRPQRGEFQLTLAADTSLARHLAVGARFGALLTSGPSGVGVPLDLRLRVRVQRLYLEGLVGPWILFDEPDPFRIHAAFGFGLVSGGLLFGVEVGYLDPSALVGVRLAFRL